jgi:DUF4097 and DUF4098 domain-containing protein YvlB
MFLRSIASIGLLGLVATGSAFAGTPVEQTRALNADGQVGVENLKGRIVVRTWAQPQVKITGTLGAGVEKLQVDGDARSLRIKVKYPDDRGWHLWSNGTRAEPSVIEVTVPQHASLDLDSVSADIDVEQMAGHKLSAQTVSGNTRIVASSPGDAHVESVSGDQFLRITTPKVSVESVSGDIDLQGGLTGDVRMQSVSGNLRLGAGRLDSFNLDTVSGDGQLRFDVAPTGVAKAETLSGDLQVSLPRNASTRLHVETFSGDIRSVVGSVKKEEGPGKTLDARLGDGQAQVNLETFSGDVTVDTQ